jgi:peptidoglycan/LPS O-acetylase OafA/YrhL
MDEAQSEAQSEAQIESVSGAPAAALHAGDVAAGIPPPENRKFYPALDGIRALAVLMVFYQHYLSSRPELNWGWTGVDIFFVLSGFLITGILYDTRHDARRYRNFYGRRALRIFPLYYGVLLLILVSTPFFHWRYLPSFWMWPVYLGNFSRFVWLQNWLHASNAVDHVFSARFHSYIFINHFWSLCVEEQFYLLWPPVVFLVRNRQRLLAICLTTGVVVLAARCIAAIYAPQPYLNAELLYRATPFRIDALLYGGALALALRGPLGARLARRAVPLFLLFLCAFGGFELLWHHTAHTFYQPAAGARGLDTFGFLFIDLFAAVLILVCLAPGTWWYRFLTLKPLRRLGQVSYGFYVFHDIPHHAYAALAHALMPRLAATHGTATAAIALLCTLAISFLSFRFYEAPFLRLKRHFAD